MGGRCRGFVSSTAASEAESEKVSDSGDFVPLVPYNGTDATGGDAMVENLNVYYEV